MKMKLNCKLLSKAIIPSLAIMLSTSLGMGELINGKQYSWVIGGAEYKFQYDNLYKDKDKDNQQSFYKKLGCDTNKKNANQIIEAYIKNDLATKELKKFYYNDLYKKDATVEQKTEIKQKIEDQIKNYNVTISDLPSNLLQTLLKEDNSIIPYLSVKSSLDGIRGVISDNAEFFSKEKDIYHSFYFHEQYSNQIINEAKKKDGEKDKKIDLLFTNGEEKKEETKYQTIFSKNLSEDGVIEYYLVASEKAKIILEKQPSATFTTSTSFGGKFTIGGKRKVNDKNAIRNYEFPLNKYFGDKNFVEINILQEDKSIKTIRIYVYISEFLAAFNYLNKGGEQEYKDGIQSLVAEKPQEEEPQPEVYNVVQIEEQPQVIIIEEQSVEEQPQEIIIEEQPQVVEQAIIIEEQSVEEQQRLEQYTEEQQRQASEKRMEAIREMEEKRQENIRRYEEAEQQRLAEEARLAAEQAEQERLAREATEVTVGDIKKYAEKIDRRVKKALEDLMGSRPESDVLTESSYPSAPYYIKAFKAIKKQKGR